MNTDIARLTAVCACIVASVGCDGGNGIAPAPPPPSTVTVEFSGRVVNADAGYVVGNARVSFGDVCCFSTKPAGWVLPTNSATSGGDGTFTLPLNLPRDWTSVYLKLTGPGYDDMNSSNFGPTTSGTHTEIRMYPTLVIRPGESIDVHVEYPITWCGFFGGIPCRRVLVEGSPGQPVELELVPHDSSTPMALGKDQWDDYSELRRLMVAPGGVVYVNWPGTARLTARR